MGCAMSAIMVGRLLFDFDFVTLLTLLHSERPKLYTILAFLSVIRLT